MLRFRWLIPLEWLLWWIQKVGQIYADSKGDWLRARAWGKNPAHKLLRSAMKWQGPYKHWLGLCVTGQGLVRERKKANSYFTKYKNMLHSKPLHTG